MGKINNKQIKFCNLVAEGWQASTAYREVYDSTMSPNVSNAAAYRLMQKEEVKRYIAHQKELLRNKYNIDKDKVFKNLIELYEVGQQIQEYNKKQKLTKVEKEHLGRLTTMLKGSDIIKINQEYNKMIGAYEPEKHEIKHEWDISFGDDDDDNTDKDEE